MNDALGGDIIQWAQVYGGWALVCLLLGLLWVLTGNALVECSKELEESKKEGEKPKEIIPTLYIRYTGAHYRIKVVGTAIWCERQSPRGDNIPIELNREHLPALYVGGHWDLTTVMVVIADYETIEGGQ